MDTNGSFLVDDDFLNFSLDEEEEDEKKGHSSSSSSSCTISYHGDLLSHEFEELEWLSNKDAFPSVESSLDILSVPDHHWPVSVVEDKSGNRNHSNIKSFCTSLHVPVGKRSKRTRKRESDGFPDFASVKKKKKQELALPATTNNNSGSGSIGRRCLHCLSEKTPLWRVGPMGPKTLCNACGVRYKSGRLVPEYRPANSPTFSAVLHSNSHRRIVEMRRNKEMPMPMEA